MIKDCSYVLVTNVRCGKPVGYTMQWDGGEVGSTKVRKYNPYCAEHTAIMATYKDEDDLEDEVTNPPVRLEDLLG